MIVENQGSIVVFVPENDEESAFLQENTDQAPWQWLGKNLVVDWRPALNLEREIEDAGFRVERQGDDG